MARGGIFRMDVFLVLAVLEGTLTLRSMYNNVDVEVGQQ